MELSNYLTSPPPSYLDPGPHPQIPPSHLGVLPRKPQAKGPTQFSDLNPSGLSSATFSGKLSLIAHLSWHFYCPYAFVHQDPGSLAPFLHGWETEALGRCHPVKIRQSEDLGRIPDCHMGAPGLFQKRSPHHLHPTPS